MDEKNRLKIKAQRRIREHINTKGTRPIDSFYLLRKYTGTLPYAHVKQIIDDVCKQMSIEHQVSIVAEGMSNGCMITISKGEPTQTPTPTPTPLTPTPTSTPTPTPTPTPKSTFQNFHYKYANARSPIPVHSPEQAKLAYTDLTNRTVGKIRLVN